jgi:hypothetical protein
MKKGIDTEALKKNRFWIGLGASVVFALVAFICVLGVRGTARAKFAEAKTIDEQLKKIPNDRAKLRNQQWIDQMKQMTASSERQKEAVWMDGFDKQQQAIREQLAVAAGTPSAPDGKPARGKLRELRSPVITWHEDVRDREVFVGRDGKFPTKMKDLDFGEKIDIVPRQYRETYLSQYEALVKDKALHLLNENTGTGSLRIAGSQTAGPNSRPAHDKNLLVLLKPHDFTTRPITSDEAWILQEDLALKREVLKSIAEANRLVAICQSEWRVLGQASEEEKEEAAAGTESAPAKAEPAPAAPTGDKPAEGDAKDQDTQPEKLLEEKRFYNTTWHLGLNLPERKDSAGKPLRNQIEWYEGWQLAFKLVRKGNETTLRGEESNHSYSLTMPTATVAVYFADANGKELATPAVLTNLGNLPPSQFNQQTQTHTTSKRELKPVSAPKEAARILRVGRIATAPTHDEGRFFNTEWLVDLKLVPGTGGLGAAVEAVIHNRSGKMILPAQFEVTYTDGKETFVGEALVKQEKSDPFPANTSRQATKFDVRRTQRPTRIVAVRQVFDWRSVPIKQISRIEFTEIAHKESDRTKIRDLKKYDFTKKDPFYTGAPPATTATPPPDDGSATTAAGGRLGMGSGASTASESSQRTEAHGVPLKRYYEVTNEVRRVPVALVLVVDAANLNDVLASLANSRLRIQITQVVWNRLPGGLGTPAFAKRGPPPPAPGAPAGGAPGGGTGREGGALGTGAGGATPAGYPGRPGGAGGPAGAGPAGVGPGAPARGPISVEEETNEIEVQIYGLISLFENPDALARLAEMKTKAQASSVAANP